MSRMPICAAIEPDMSRFRAAATVAALSAIHWLTRASASC